MLDPVFHEAWVHAPGGHTILGCRLHPFCALDIVALDSIKSPFLRKGETATVPDLLLAVWILSHDHPRTCSIEHLELDAAGRQWVREVTRRRWWEVVLFRRPRRLLDLVRDVAKVGAYIDDYYAVPEMFREDAQEEFLPYGTPWILSNVLAVVKNLHVPVYDAWTMEVGKLLWYCCALEEATSDKSRIIGQELREQLNLAEKGGASFKVEPGESLADLAKRVGCTEAEAEFLREQALSARSQRV